MTRFIFTLLNGITLAGLYFLVASGLTLIFGLMRVINLAHGAFYLLSGYVSWTIADKTDNWFYGAVAGSLTLGVFGTLVYVLLLRKFQYEELREPSEGLAPAIVEHLGNSLRDLVAQGQRVLLIEQNLKFASNLYDEIVILSNGEIQATISSKELRSSADLQNKYLGVA